MTSKYDAIVVGPGTNELVAAHLLARAGRKVLLVGGRADDSLEEGWVPPQVANELGLSGLESTRPDPWAEVLLDGGGRLQLWQDMARSVESIRRISPRDAERWPAFCERVRRVTGFLETLYLAPPPDPLTRDWRELMGLGCLAWRARRLGRIGIEDLLRLLPMNAADLLDDWFESDALKGLLGSFAVRHLHQGPRAGGTSFTLLHGHAGCPVGVFRAPRSNLRQALRVRPGIETSDAEVRQVIVKSEAVHSIALSDGREIETSLVLSGLDPKRTFGLVDAAWLDPELLRAVRNIRSRGVAARVLLELERAPDFSTLTIAPSLDFVERAHDDAKYKRVSRQPVLDAVAGSHNGKPCLDVNMQYAPYVLAEDPWDDVQRGRLGQQVVEALSGVAVVDRRIFSPVDLEASEGWPEGQPHHAEITLDQALWMRPIPELARYRTPIKGLLLCGPAMHPGGGILGAAGLLCAREALAA